MQLATFAIGAVATVHFLIAGVEMFFWTRPKVYQRLKSLNLSSAEAEKIAPIVANAGLYNGFIGAGLAWSLAAEGTSVTYFFLACVVVAGLFGAATLSWKTVVLQSIPAVVAAVLLYVASNPMP